MYPRIGFFILSALVVVSCLGCSSGNTTYWYPVINDYQFNRAVTFDQHGISCTVYGAGLWSNMYEPIFTFSFLNTKPTVFRARFSDLRMVIRGDTIPAVGRRVYDPHPDVIVVPTDSTVVVQVRFVYNVDRLRIYNSTGQRVYPDSLQIGLLFPPLVSDSLTIQLPYFGYRPPRARN